MNDKVKEDNEDYAETNPPPHIHVAPVGWVLMPGAGYDRRWRRDDWYKQCKHIGEEKFSCMCGYPQPWLQPKQ